MVTHTIPTSDFLRESINEQVFNSLSDEQVSRIEAAIEGQYPVYPTAKGSYKIINSDSDSGATDGSPIRPRSETSQEQTVYTAQYNSTTESCTCKDFTFRGVSEESSFSFCKHLWRIWVLRQVDLLPNEDEEPKDWFYNKFAILLRVVDAEQTNQVARIVDSIKSTPASLLDYEQLYGELIQLELDERYQTQV